MILMKNGHVFTFNIKADICKIEDGVWKIMNTTDGSVGMASKIKANEILIRVPEANVLFVRCLHQNAKESYVKYSSTLAQTQLDYAKKWIEENAE